MNMNIKDYNNIANDPKTILEFIADNVGAYIYCVDFRKDKFDDNEVLAMLDDLCKKFDNMHDTLYPKNNKKSSLLSFKPYRNEN